MSSARHALAWSFTNQYLSTILQFVTTIFISRLLTPAELGVYSLAATFVVLGQLLRDFGSGQYIIQEKELTDDRIRSAFSVTLASGWSVAALVFLAAPYVGDFFAEPGVARVMHLLALNFALIPFGSITVAYLQRKMQFRLTMTVRLSTAVVSSVTSISCAFAGMSYIALAWGAVAGSITAALVANLLRPRELPVLPGFKEIPRVLSFSTQMSASTIIGQLGPISIDMIVGKILGTAALGLLSRAQGVIKLFEALVMRGLHPVLTPLFAEKHRDGHRLATSYLYGTTCLTGLAWPFYAGLAVLAPDFIYVLFGENWVAAGPLVQISCVAIILRGPGMLANHLFIATGNISVLLRRQLVIMPTGVVVAFFAAHISLEALAIASTPMTLFWLTLVLPQIMRIAGISGRALSRALSPSLLVTLASTLSAWLALQGLEWLGVNHAAVRLVGGGLAGGLAYLAAILLLRHPLATEGRGVLRKLTGRNAPDPA